MNTIFILGCERSGSTWLSNILDSHPSVEFYMEPFAAYAQLFPGFSGRFSLPGHSDKKLIEDVSDMYKQLRASKYPLLYSPGSTMVLKNIDKIIIQMYSNILKGLHIRPSLVVLRYLLLNLNTSKVPIIFQYKKDRDASLTVIKELRLNFKIPILSVSFEKARYLISIRHPGAQINSILKLFNQGGLKELRESLAIFPAELKNVERFAKYEKLFNELGDTKDIELILGLWWIINYDILIKDLKSQGLPYYIVYHEELSSNPQGIMETVLEFSKLESSGNVIKYIEFSSNYQSNKENPLDTSRVSRKYFTEAINNVPDRINKKVLNILNSLEIEEEVCRYCR